MKVNIFSRRKIQILLQGDFLANTAVISFYDPDKIPVDYNGKAERLIQIPLDDFQRGFPEAGDLAKFIDKAKSDGLNIICQCESGQSRSAGCAAAILEYYYQSGNIIFDNDRYYLDQMVYHKVFDALETVSNSKGI